MTKRITHEYLAQITGVTFSNKNLFSVFIGLHELGKQMGLDRPHRLAMYLGQLSHESMGFIYDREVWGPTAAQKRYEGRKDLGNIYAGDGSKYRGYTSIQITGRHNTTEFMQWCRSRASHLKVPDFVKSPELMNTDPWEGLGPIWYWDSRKINASADRGDYARVTQIINGGMNGYTDRCNRYVSIALRMLGYNAGQVKAFQTKVGLKADGIAGTDTRNALHQALTKVPAYTFTGSVGSKPSKQVKVGSTESKPNLIGVIIGGIIAAIAAAIGYNIIN